MQKKIQRLQYLQIARLSGYKKKDVTKGLLQVHRLEKGSGAFAFFLNFLVTFSFKRKSNNRKLKQQGKTS